MTIRTACRAVLTTARITLATLVPSATLEAQYTHPVAAAFPSAEMRAGPPSSDAAPAARGPGPRCPSYSRASRAVLLATGVFVLPVALVALKTTDDGWRAARWATYAGSAYTLGATTWLMSGRMCTSTDPLAYIWAPVAAAGGAALSTRTR